MGGARAARVEAPAKTNLFLEVVRRRADGFHELDTVFAALDLTDELEVAVPAPTDARAHAPDAPAGALELTVRTPEGAPVPDVPEDASNLVLRAAAALRARAGLPGLAARIRLTKRIPAGGGLGGGSSDAAAALVALDRLWGLDLGAAALHALAADLGSDVAFFLRAGLQRGRGRGELLEPLPPPPRPVGLVLVLPGLACPTPAVYRALAPFLPAAPRAPDALLAALAAGDLEAVAGAAFNRLEAAALAAFPDLAPLRRDLEARPGVLGVLLSGSGSTWVALTRDPDGLAGALARDGLRAVATRTRA